MPVSIMVPRCNKKLGAFFINNKTNSNDTCAWTPNKIKYGLPMCVAHMHFSKQQTRSKWSMSAYIAMLCSSGAQCSVSVVTLRVIVVLMALPALHMHALEQCIVLKEYPEDSINHQRVSGVCSFQCIHTTHSQMGTQSQEIHSFAPAMLSACLCDSGAV